jgi:hypothetical protein
MEQKELSGFIDRYISMWPEPNPELRNDFVLGLLTKDAENLTTKFAARGIDEILPRVNRSYIYGRHLASVDEGLYSLSSYKCEGGMVKMWIRP